MFCDDLLGETSSNLAHKVGEGLAEEARVGVEVDGVLGPVEVVLPPGLHVGHVQGLAHGLHVVGGDGRTGPKDCCHPGLHELTEPPAGLEAVVLGEGPDNVGQARPCHSGSVVIDHLEGTEEGPLLGLGSLLKQRPWIQASLLPPRFLYLA